MAVDFLPFATGVGANVEDQASYAAASFVTNGFSAGLAQSQQLNKVWRQSAFIAAVIANWINQETGVDVLDDGNLAGLITKFQNAVVVGAGIKPATLVTTSTAFNVLANMYRVAFARTVTPAALNAQLPTLGNGSIGQSFKIGDVAHNAGTFPITVLPPGGQSIGGQANYQIAVDNQWAEFAWLGNNTWSVEL